ncbi:MBL fold metallo-hydrolase [Halorussus litoreus]|uniref:MBL fold metallo-hydrolase n=1 Tax=Halorussus litoreus TaxID=1710536 RepID=UPI000E27CCB9|nr:MBL fold metallo-hydrolase [Halorussus litoreus]
MFTRLSIPTPFEVGPVNAYLAGRTLVDPGPGSEGAWAALLDGLEARELVPSDLERVVITHPHPDHFGLAKRLREEGVRVLASPQTAEIVADFEGRFEYERSYFVDCFERHGMARSTAETVTDLPESFLRVAPGVETDRVLDDGDQFEVAGTAVTTEAVQGHAAGETIFSYETDAGEQRALVGDHVLPDITPNPLLQPPPETGGERPRVLPAFNRSLAALREREFDRFLPGHREEITSPGERVAEILDAHEDRTAKVREIVADGPITAVEVMEELFGDLPATEYFPAMSEAVGHLDVLVERDAVEPRERGGVVVYESVEDEAVET